VEEKEQLSELNQQQWKDMQQIPTRALQNEQSKK
jgi:hypothetical protein